MKENISQHFRVAILGAGNISTEHAETLCWLPNTKIAAVCDLDGDRAKRLADKYKIPSIHDSIDELLEKIKPDVVHVLSPPGAHVGLAVKCLKAGSNVFVEKPIGTTLKECMELKKVSDETKLKVGVNHNMVYRPSVQGLVEQVRNRKFGRIVHVNIAWSMPPSKILNVPQSSYFLKETQNALFEWAVHPLSVIQRLVGKVEDVSALVGDKIQTAGGGEFYSTWQSSMQCNRGTAQLLVSVGHGFRYLWMNILGEDAFAHVDLLNDSMIIDEYTPYRPAVAGLRDACMKASYLIKSASVNAKNYVLSSLGKPLPASSHQAGMRNSMRAFYNALEKNVDPPEGINQGMAVVDYCERIFKDAFPTMQEEVDGGKK